MTRLPREMVLMSSSVWQIVAETPLITAVRELCQMLNGLVAVKLVWQPVPLRAGVLNHPGPHMQCKAAATSPTSPVVTDDKLELPASEGPLTLHTGNAADNNHPPAWCSLTARRPLGQTVKHHTGGQLRHCSPAW